VAHADARTTELIFADVQNESTQHAEWEQLAVYGTAKKKWLETTPLKPLILQRIWCARQDSNHDPLVRSQVVDFR